MADQVSKSTGVNRLLLFHACLYCNLLKASNHEPWESIGKGPGIFSFVFINRTPHGYIINVSSLPFSRSCTHQRSGLVRQTFYSNLTNYFLCLYKQYHTEGFALSHSAAQEEPMEGGVHETDASTSKESFSLAWRNPYVLRLAFSAGIGGLLFGYDTGQVYLQLVYIYFDFPSQSLSIFLVMKSQKTHHLFLIKKIYAIRGKEMCINNMLIIEVWSGQKV